MKSKDPTSTLTVNTVWPLLLTGVLLLTQLAFPSKVWVVLLWIVGGVTGLGYLWARQLQRHVRATRKLRYGWVQVGDRLEEQFTLTNRSWLPVLWAEVIDHSDLPGYEVRRIAGCNAQGTTRWTTEQVCARRGIFTLGPWSLRLSDPFGFFTVTLHQEEQAVIAVYPQVVELPHINLPRGLAAGPSRANRRSAEVTIDVSKTRLYQPDDPLRLIHWRSTAHRGDLVVREFDTEISGDLWIVVDLDQGVQAGQEEESTQEYAIILAASLADRTLRQNRAVGLLAHGSEQALVPPGRGKSHMWRLLHVLAASEAGGGTRLADVLHGLRASLGQGTTLLIITPSCEPEWVDALLPLTRTGMVPSVVLLDAASFESPPPPANPAEGPTRAPSVGAARMRELLVEAGLTTHVIERGYPFPHTPAAQRRGFWEFKVTPLGRAVVVRRPDEA